MRRKALFPSEPGLTLYRQEWIAAAQVLPTEVRSPFTAKALYAFGMMRHLMESAAWALRPEAGRQPFHIAAYLLSCGAIELLGRCVRGEADEKRGSCRRLEAGLKKIASLPQTAKDSEVVLRTSHRHYTIADCCNLRNFCAHGASSSQQYIGIDVELQVGILKALAAAVEVLWGELRLPQCDDARQKLATCAIAPLFVYPGQKAIHVAEMYNHVSQGKDISAGLMYRAAWQTGR